MTDQQRLFWIVKIFKKLMPDLSFYFNQKYFIPSTRLKNWDYSSVGFYFVTICTYQKRCYFGEIVEGGIRLSEIGKIAKKYWLEIPKHFKNTRLDEFIIMPNHIHGIIAIEYKIKCRDVINHVSTNNNVYSQITPMGKQSLGEIIRFFKAKTTYEIHQSLKTNFLWQPRFYDHIIRNDKSLDEIRQYIKTNPLKWEEDEENPKNQKNNL
jgi:hypothetical protein